ncbi:MAG: hypothetical protein VX608_07140 [Chloroflexota bacterium]|nr:hypothetical protein [Chloroflexota bacterium]
MRFPVVRCDSFFHYVKQHFGFVDHPSVFQHLAGMETRDGQRRRHRNHVHACGDPGLHPVGRIFRHEAILRLDLKLLGGQQVNLRVWFGILHVLAS